MISVLALETSTNVGSVAIIDRTGRLASRESVRQRSHSEFIHPAIEECLEELSLEIDDLDVFAVGQGPGSFTGIRVAGNSLKALAWALDKPLVSVDSLSLLARGTPVCAEQLFCTFNAFRNMLYFSSFKPSSDKQQWDLIEGPIALSPEEFEARIRKPSLILGDALEVYEDLLSPDSRSLLNQRADLKNYPRAPCLAQWVFEEPERAQNSSWEHYSPLYIRSTDSLFKKQRS